LIAAVDLGGGIFIPASLMKMTIFEATAATGCLLVVGSPEWAVMAG